MDIETWIVSIIWVLAALTVVGFVVVRRWKRNRSNPVHAKLRQFMCCTTHQNLFDNPAHQEPIRLPFVFVTQYYTAGTEHRQSEIDRCLQNNVKQDIDNVVVMTEDSADMENARSLLGDVEKVTFVNLEHRMTYFDAIDYTNKNFAGHVVMIANSDILITDEDTMAPLRNVLAWDNIVLSLLRWEETTGEIYGKGRADSQDTWIYQSPLLIPKDDCDFALGIPGCDNAISERFHRHGYHVLNPSKTIKTWHVHSEDAERTYNANTVKVPQPYLQVHPC